MSTPIPSGQPDDDALRVNGRTTIPRDELEVRATRSGGPGGQHVNTSSTRIEVRWNPAASRVLSDEQKARLAERLVTRLDSAGWLRVVGSEHRSQLRNREAAEERLADLVRRALVVPKARTATKPSRAARARRMDEKRKQGERKRNRRYRGED